VGRKTLTQSISTSGRRLSMLICLIQLHRETVCSKRRWSGAIGWSLIHSVEADTTRHSSHSMTYLLTYMDAWHSGRTSISDRRTFPVLRSTCSWRV